MDNIFTLRLIGVWLKVYVILSLMLCSAQELNGTNRIDIINGVRYRSYSYPESYPTELGYGEAIALEYVGTEYTDILNINTTLEHRIPGTTLPGGSYYTETFKVTEIADQFCNYTNTVDGSGPSNTLDGLVIPKYIKRIGVDAFAGCKKLTKINFQSTGLEEIDKRAFKGCSGIKSMNLNSCTSLCTIGVEAFSNCSGLTNVFFPESVQQIGANAFEFCTALTHVSLPNTLETIEGGTFYGCTNLTSFKLPYNLKEIRGAALANSGISGYLSLPKGLRDILFSAFSNCKNLRGSLHIPDSVKNIDSQAFMGCHNISGSLTFGKNVQYIGQDAFKNIGSIDAVIVKAQNPPKGYAFPDTIYENAVLYVPKGTASKYTEATLWRDFAHIEEIEHQAPTKIEATIGPLTATTSYYPENLIVVEKGTKIPVKSAVTPDNPVNNHVYWESSDTSVCQVKNGYLEMKADGYAILTARTCNNLDVSFKIQEGTPISTIGLPDTITVELGKQSSIQYNALPEGKHFGQMKWEISDQSVAEIDLSNGRIKGIKLGIATLNATAGDGWGASDTCIVKIIPPHATNVALNKNEFSYSKVDSHTPLQLTATVSPYNAIQDVIWTSSNEQIATVDARGLVTFHGYGKVKIKAAAAENKTIYDECIITLKYDASVTLNGNKYSAMFSIYQDDKQLKFEIESDPQSLPITDVEFSSSDETVFSVEADGKAKWISKGFERLYCNYKLYGEPCQMKFYVSCKPARYVTSLSFKEPSIDVMDGESFNIDLTNLDIVPADAVYNEIEWSVSDETIIGIDTSSNHEAKFTAKGIGETDIIAKAKHGNATAICHTTVLPIPVSYIELNSDISNGRMELGNSINIYASIEPYNASNKSLTWSVCDNSVAVITEQHPDAICLEAIGFGETDVIAKAEVGNVTEKFHIIVEYRPIKELYFYRQYINGNIGDEVQLEAFIYPPNASNQTVIWESSNPDIASVDDSGMVILKKAGSCYISAISDDNPDIKATCNVSVSEFGSIESVIDDKDSFVRIYNIDGILVYEGIYSNAILLPGYYILYNDGNSTKLRITSMPN